MTERSDGGVDDLRSCSGRVSSSSDEDSGASGSFASDSVVSSSDATAGRAEDDRGGGDDLSGEVGAAVNVEVLLVACRPVVANLRGSDIADGGGRSTILDEDAPPLAACLSLSISRFNASSSAAPSSSSSSSPSPRPPSEVIHPVADVENRFSSALDGDSLGIDRSEARAGSDEAKSAANEGVSESG